MRAQITIFFGVNKSSEENGMNKKKKRTKEVDNGK